MTEWLRLMTSYYISNINQGSWCWVAKVLTSYYNSNIKVLMTSGLLTTTLTLTRGLDDWVVKVDDFLLQL